MKSFVATSVALMGMFAATPGFAVEVPSPPATPGTYQMSVDLEGNVILCNTSTGQCWKKPSRGGSWIDLGSPKRTTKEKAEKPVRLNLPQDIVELTVRQRRSKAVPGSDGEVRLRVSDITVSVKPGDVLKFRVGKTDCYMRVKELQNFLIGDDFAVFQFTSNRDALKKRTDVDSQERKVRKERALEESDNDRDQP
jgi:hypothetical protein